MIFHLECSLNTGRRTHKQQCSHMHITGIRCTPNPSFLLGQCKWQRRWGTQLCPSFLLPLCLSLPLIQAQSNGRNVNEQSINANVVHSISIPSLSITEICGPLSPFLKKMCLEKQQFPCSWKTQMVKILAVVSCPQWSQYFISWSLQNQGFHCPDANLVQPPPCNCSQCQSFPRRLKGKKPFIINHY